MISNEIRYQRQIRYRRIFICLLLLLLFLMPLSAATLKYTGEFLKFGLGVREMSLGGAAFSDPRAVSASYWNPAALFSNERFSGQFMHTEEFAGILNLDHLSLALPNKNGLAWGVAYFRLGVDDIPDTRNALIDVGRDGLGPNDPGYPGPDPDGSEANGVLDDGERLDFGKIGRFGSSENAILVSVARPLREKFTLGATVKGIYRSLSQSAFGLGLDVAARYAWCPNLQISAALYDVTTTMIFWDDGVKEIILPTLRGGLVWKLQPAKLPIAIHSYAALDANLEGAQNDRDIGLGFTNLRARLGLELEYRGFLLLRGGRDDLGAYHLGCGLALPIGALDYGFAMGGAYRELGESHRLSLTIHFRQFGRQLRRWL